MMTKLDTINAAFEFVGAAFTWGNFLKLRKEKEIRGVYWPTFAFFLLFGIWNLIFYSSLNQPLSTIAGAILCGGNLAWVIQALILKNHKQLAKPFK